MNNKTLFLDLETTGLNPVTHGIIQIAAEYHVNGEKVSSFDQRINYLGQTPPTISLGALRVNATKLGDIFNKDYGQPQALAIIAFVDWLLTLDLKNTTIVGHNINFDINFINSTLKQLNAEGFEELIGRDIEDTKYLASSMIKAGKLDCTKTSLGPLADHLKVEYNQLHDAAEDTRITAEIYYKLIDILKGKK